MYPGSLSLSIRYTAGFVAAVPLVQVVSAEKICQRCQKRDPSVLLEGGGIVVRTRRSETLQYGRLWPPGTMSGRMKVMLLVRCTGRYAKILFGTL